MTWPLMFRATHEALVRAEQEKTAFYRDELAAERARHAPPPPPPPKEKREPDQVDTAIELRAGVDMQLKRHLARYAKMRRAEGVEVGTIAKEILHGDEADDEDGVP